MADLLIEKDKKTEWLKKYGTPNALELLGQQVEDMNSKAVQNRLLSKETNQMESNESVEFADPLATLTEEKPSTQTTHAAPVAEPVVVENKEVQTPTPEAEVVTEEVAENTTTEPVVKSVESTDEDEQRQLVDVFINDVVNPVLDEMKSLRQEVQEIRSEKSKSDDQIVALQKQVDTLQKELQAQGLQIQVETLPQASTVALVKNYIQERLGNGNLSTNGAAKTSGVFGKALNEDDSILNLKPAEGKVKSAVDEGTFAGFVEGI